MILTRRERVLGWCFVAPAALFVTVFVIWPTAHMVLTSFRHASWSSTQSGGFAGLSNYTDLFSSPAFRHSLRNTALFAVLVVPLQTALALLFAVWVNGVSVTRRFLRIAVFVPTTISLAVLSILWKLMYEPSGGLLNGLLASVGLSPQPFLTSTHQALPAIVAMSIWQGVGLQMLVFLSGLQQIPKELYEAARLDGAGPWRCFRNVTLPSLAPTTVFVVMVTTILALRLFVQPHLMTGGGPEFATLSIVQYIRETAFLHRDLGLACAAGTVFLVLVLLLTLVLRRLLRAAEVPE